MATKLNFEPPLKRQRLTQTQEPTPGFGHLDHELLVSVFRCLNAANLKTVGMVNKHWHGISNDHNVWGFFLQQRGFQQLEVEHPKATFERIYSNFKNGMCVNGIITDETARVTDETARVETVFVDGDFLYSGYENGWIRIFNPITHQCIKSFDTGGACDFIATSRGLVISGSEDYDTLIWDLKTDTSKVISDKGIQEGMPLVDDGSQGIKALAVTNHMLLTYSKDDKIWVWNLGNDACEYQVQESKVKVVTAAGDSFILGYEDGVVKALNLKTYKLDVMRSLDQYQFIGEVTALTTIDQFLIVGFGSGCIEIWDLESGVLKHAIQGYSADITSLVAGCGVFFSASVKGTMKIWDLNTAQLLFEVPIHKRDDKYDKICMTMASGVLFLAARISDDDISSVNDLSWQEYYNNAISFWDFTATDNKILQQIVWQFSETAIERYSKMRISTRAKVYAEAMKILQKACLNYEVHSGANIQLCGWQGVIAVTPEQLRQAIVAALS